MKVPQEIQRLANEGLKGVSNVAHSHFDWRIRREMYRQFRGTVGEKQGQLIHGWLSVISAEYVLPIFTSTFAKDPLPKQLIKYARRILEGQVSTESKRLDILEDQGYMGTGIDMLDLRGDIVAYNAEYAGEAAYKSLMEARRSCMLLEGVETLRRDYDGGLIMGGGSTSPEFDHLEHGSTFTDEDIAHLAAFSDAASSAAIAFSCEVERFALRQAQLQLFWQWWVNEALPEAWSHI